MNWDPALETSLSDLEVVNKDLTIKIWEIKYQLEGTDEFVTVATTRPETILGDSAICVNPNDKRYKNLIGKKAIVPIVQREIPIIADKYVDIEYDTYKYVRKNPKSAAQKIKCGRKMCRYVQFEGEKKGIMPTVLSELLASRKATRKLIKYKTVTLKDGTTHDGMLSKGDEYYTLVSNKGEKQQ